MNNKAKRSGRLLKRFLLWSRRTGLNRKAGFALASAAAVSGVATLAIMTGALSYGPASKVLINLLYFDAVLLLLLVAVVARRIAAVSAERIRGKAGSGLHFRLVAMFSLVAITPAILVAVFSMLFINYGLEHWFSERVRTAIEESNAVAKAYLHEHQQNVRADALAVANNLNADAQVLQQDMLLFNDVLTAQADLRALPELVVINGGGQVMARSRLSLSLEFDLAPESAIKSASGGNIAVIVTNEREDRVRAVVRLVNFADAYLLVGRFIDSSVLEHIYKTARAVAEYKSLEKEQKGFQLTFLMIFIVVTVLLLLAAVWVGVALATQLARPISNLISAAEQVRKGNLEVSVKASDSADEIGALSRAFLRMTRQLKSQRQGLMDVNRQLDERRRFTETVLSGVTAGVIGLDGNGLIHLPNRSASELLATDLESAIGKHLRDIAPEMSPLLEMAMAHPDRLRQAEVTLARDGVSRTLLARIAAERMGKSIIGYVVTFDDITELMLAQRKAAWSDVARRIAHEIKNPLTPIQLSAERLKRKYLKEIKSDPDIFSSCTETIIRQVTDIGRMVDEFSSFARMPQPDMKPENLSEICRQAVFIEKNRHMEIEYITGLPAKNIFMRCDASQISQALINLLKNAAESVDARMKSSANGQPPGWVKTSLTTKDGQDGPVICIAIEDNGIGLPREHRNRLTEPYVTGRSKGTGLGLAIVKKIMEDHNGILELDDRKEGGARAAMLFPQTDETTRQKDSGQKRGRTRQIKAATDIETHG